MNHHPFGVMVFQLPTKGENIFPEIKPEVIKHNG